MAVKRYAESQSLLHQVNPSNGWESQKTAKELFVAIPSSSGQSFQPAEEVLNIVTSSGRNPFFIRSILPTGRRM